MNVRIASVIAAATLGLAACAQPFADSPAVSGPTGAAVGAAGGAAAGQLIGGDTRSTIVGGVLGATAGGIAGSEAERQRLARQGQPLQQHMGGEVARPGQRMIQ